MLRGFISLSSSSRAPPATAAPLEPACFWIEIPNKLVIGYHWLAFLNWVSISEKYWSTINLEWKFCQTKKCKKHECFFCFCIRFRTSCIFQDKRIWPFLEGAGCMSFSRTGPIVYLEKNWCLKIDFSNSLHLRASSFVCLKKKSYMQKKISAY